MSLCSAIIALKVYYIGIIYVAFTYIIYWWKNHEYFISYAISVINLKGNNTKLSLQFMRHTNACLILHKCCNRLRVYFL